MKYEQLLKPRIRDAQTGSYVEGMTSGVSPAELVSMNLCLRQAHDEQYDGLFGSEEDE